MVPPAWPMYMPHYLPRPQAQQSSMQAEREKLASLVCCPRGGKQPQMYSGTATLKPKCASSNVASQRSLAPTQGPPSEIKLTSNITTKTVKPPPTSPRVGTDQDMKAMVQDMIRSSLTQFRVIPKKIPTQSPAQDITMEPVSPQKVDLSEGEISDSEQEGPNSGTPQLDQLMLTPEKPLDYDSFVLASPSVTD